MAFIRLGAGAVDYYIVGLSVGLSDDWFMNGKGYGWEVKKRDHNNGYGYEHRMVVKKDGDEGEESVANDRYSLMGEWL